MNLVPYIFLLCPSLIGVSFYNKLAKEKKYNFIKYFIYILLSNMLMFLILKYITSFNGDIYSQLENYSYYSFRYGLLSIIVNLFIGYIDFIKLEYFDFKVEVKNDKKH